MPSKDQRFLEIKATGDLPSPTGVALAILQLTQREDCTTDEIAKVIMSDPALTGRLLKYANSARTHRLRPVVAVNEAVTVVGLNPIRQLVLGLSVLSNHREGLCETFDYQTFWSHSIAMAVAAMELCRVGQPFSPEESFTCGLLSGVGRLALATIYPRQYADVLTLLDSHTAGDLLPTEEHCFAINHVKLGKAMLLDWGLPEAQVDALDGMYHPDPALMSTSPRSFALSRILHLARELGHVWLADEHVRPSMIAPIIAESEWLGIEQNLFMDLFDNMVAQWQEWCAILDVSKTEVPSIAELVERSRLRTPALNAILGATRAKPGLNLLVIDDDRTIVELLRKQLTDFGHSVMAASNGKEGLQMAMDHCPQLIITDWIMPEMNGIEFCKAMRKTRFGLGVYIIMLTALEDEDSLVEAFEAGADDYIIKPVKPNVLKARICGGERVIRLQGEIEREKLDIRKCIAEIAIANRRLEEAALTDVLTGLPNRRYAMRRLDQQWSAARRTGQPLTCMVVDIDFFKSINDKFGHAGGDTVLRDVANILRAAARKDDEVCRLGGEEFLIICDNTDANAAQITAERVRSSIEQHDFDVEGIVSKLTASVGVAVQRPSDTNPDSLLRAADTASYAAKRKGRNRVCMITGVVGSTAQPGSQTFPAA
jgi:diguanylate cyclase (GGDEF)-like protein